MVCYPIISEAESSLFKEFVGTNFDAIPAIKSTESSKWYFYFIWCWTISKSTFIHLKASF
jgi:hypothetical protein